MATQKEIQERNPKIIKDRLEHNLTTGEIGEKYDLTTQRIRSILKTNTEAAKTISHGQPLKFKTPKELEEKINEYFESCWETLPLTDTKNRALLDENDKPIYQKIQTQPYLITALAVHLDTTRNVLLDYENKYGEKNIDFSNTVRRAKQICQAYAEGRLFTQKSAEGPKFNLKNNYGWKDRQEVEHTGQQQQVNIAFIGDRTRQRIEEMQERIKYLESKLAKYEQIESKSVS